MATVLLADDERLFKAVQGTLLLRDGCRLLKASAASLPAASTSHRPDLILVGLTDAVSKRAFARLAAHPALARVPVIALDFSGRAGPAEAPEESGKTAAREVVKAPDTTEGRSRGRQEGILARSLERHLRVPARGGDRVAACVTARCRVRGSSFLATTKDISPSGVFLKTSRTLSVGERVEVRFVAPAAAGPRGAKGPPRPTEILFAGSGRVVRVVAARSADEKDLIPGAAIHLTDVGGAGRAALRLLAHRGRPTARAERPLPRRRAALR